MTVDDASGDFDLLAASLRADATDLHAFIEALAERLSAALPGRLEVRRARQGLRGPKLVRELSLDADGVRLMLEREGARVRALLARVSGGIVLKREEVELDVWIETLAEVLAAEAQRSATARQALERLLLN